MTHRDNAPSAFLDEVHAGPLWSVPLEHRSQIELITAYMARQTVFLVLCYSDGNGWDLYLPADPHNSIELTLDAARKCLAPERRETQ
jgi:hypothetical protein